MKKIILLMMFFSGLCLGASGVQASSIPDDFMLWTELKITHPIKESKFVFQWATETRLDNNVRDFMVFNTTAGFYYQLTDWFQPGLYYRLEKEDGKDIENRIFPEGTFSTKWGPVKFAFRNRFEFRIFPDDFRFRYRLRVKLGPKYKVASITLSPFVANEFFFEARESNGGFNQDRVSTGLTLGFLNGLVKYTPYFMVRFDKKDPWIHRYIFGNSVELTF